MKKLVAATFVGVALAGTVGTGPVQAAPVPLGACLTDWYVNGPDETNRKPETTATGLRFEASDLIHHATSVPLKDLKPGNYVATPAPDQPSFFSVEVTNANGAYGTLRWNPTAAKWLIVIGAGNGATAGTFEDANPVTLLTGKVTKWGAFDPATAKVVSFGVGYTENPPGTVATTVSSVTFADTKYSLVCVAPSQSASTSASASVSPSASRTASTSATPTPGASLPITGDRAALYTGIGIGVLALGGVLAWIGRKRRIRFDG